jgi:site-specific DNA-methyltransferase (adenine-specific)
MDTYYENENIKLYCGDCLEIMPQLNIKFDACITDPPYGTIYAKWDEIIDFNKMWMELNNLIKENGIIALFSVQPFTTKLINSNFDKFSYELIWKKNTPTGMLSANTKPMRYHENIVIFNQNSKSTYNPIMMPRTGEGKSSYKKERFYGSNKFYGISEKFSGSKKYDPDFVHPSTVLEFNTVPNRKYKLHPTQKPVPLLEWLIKTYSNEGEIILDFCAGSGSLGEACINTNRKCILIEKDEKYCEIIKERLIKISEKGLLF